eukprot:355485-Chlamydomonas_euryale.AAC.2
MSGGAVRHQRGLLPLRRTTGVWVPREPLVGERSALAVQLPSYNRRGTILGVVGTGTAPTLTAVSGRLQAGVLAGRRALAPAEEVAAF